MDGAACKAHLRQEAALDRSVEELHVVTLDLERLPALEQHLVAPCLMVEPLDDARLPIVLRRLREPRDSDASVGGKRRGHGIGLCRVIDHCRIQRSVVLWRGHSW